MCRFCLFLLSYRIGGASRGLSRRVMFLVTNYRIFLTRRTSCHAENHGWSRMSVMNFLFYHELSNFRINTFNHTENRGRSRVFITNNRDLFFGPTDQREVIIELLHSITRSVAEGHELSNSRINTFNHTENRGRSRFFVTRLVLWTH